MAHIDLPPGYTARGASIDDAGTAAKLLRVCSMAEGGRPGFTEDDLANWWGVHYIDLAEDVCLVADEDGELVGIEMISQAAPHVLAIAFGGVRPDHYGSGVGSALVSWALRRSGERIPLAPPDAAITIHVYAFADHEPSVSLLEGSGLDLVRYFLEMEVEFDGPPPAPLFPEGVTLRNLVPGADDMDAALMMRAAFRDHFGYVETDKEESLLRFRQRLEHPGFDPDLWWLAEAEGRLIGGVWSDHSSEGDETMAYVATLGVAREWRGRGLGKALLLHAFGQFHELGKRGASLGVDADSLTGATRLYESVGMKPVARYASFGTQLRPGVDLMTSDLG